MKLLGLNLSSFNQFFSRSSEQRPNQSITTIVEENITPATPSTQHLPKATIVVESFEDEDDDDLTVSHTSLPDLQAPEPQQRQEPQRNRFFERIASTVSIRSFNEAHQYLMGLNPTPETLTSIRTCRALERVVIKTVRRGASRDELLQHIENIRRARANGEMNEALKELLSVYMKINATPKPETEAPPENANIFALRRFQRQHDRVDRKNEIASADYVNQLKNLVIQNFIQQLQEVRVVGENREMNYLETDCLQADAIDLYRDINKFVTRDPRARNDIETALVAAKSQTEKYYQSTQVSNQLETLMTQVQSVNLNLYNELDQITRAVRGY